MPLLAFYFLIIFSTSRIRNWSRKKIRKPEKERKDGTRLSCFLTSFVLRSWFWYGLSRLLYPPEAPSVFDAEICVSFLPCPDLSSPMWLSYQYQNIFWNDMPVIVKFTFPVFLVYPHFSCLSFLNFEWIFQIIYLTMFPCSFVNLAIVALWAEKLDTTGDTSSKECSAWVASNSSIVNMVVGNITTNMTGNFPDEFGPFSFGSPATVSSFCFWTSGRWR